MHSVTRRPLHRVVSRCRFYSDTAAPRANQNIVSDSAQGNPRVASSLDGISIPHRDEIVQKRSNATYTPNISYLQGGATSKSSLAKRLASRSSNAPVTSSILNKAKTSQLPNSTPRLSTPTPTPNLSSRPRAQIVVTPRKEGEGGQNGARPWFNAKKAPPANAGARLPNRVGAGPGGPPRGQRTGPSANRTLPQRPLPPNARAHLGSRQSSAQNPSGRGKNAPKKKKSRRQVEAEEKEGGEPLRIIDQLPPNISFTPDFTPSDLKSLALPSSELRRSRTVFEHAGGDYSRFGPHTTLSNQDVKAKTVNMAEVTLSQQKDVGLTQRVKAVDMIKKSVGLSSQPAA